MGLLVIISGPAGSGKDTIIGQLLKIFPSSCKFVTTTSRPMRPGNREGVDHYFISTAEFKRRLAAGEFVEHNIYNGHYYGSERARLNELSRSYQLLFTTIDVNGKHSLDKLHIPNLSFFILPGSLENLAARMRRRGGLTEEQITDRLAIARYEIAESTDYDCRVVNKEGKLSATVAEIETKIRASIAKNQHWAAFLDKTD